MKKILVLFLMALTVCLFTGCTSDDTENDNKTSNVTSKPSATYNSTPASDKPESEPDKKPDNSLTSKPVQKPNTEVVKKTPQELIIGKWETIVEISEYLENDLLENQDYEILDEVFITLISEFKADGTLNQKVDESNLASILQNALQIHYKEEIYDTVTDDFSDSAIYKFEDDVLLIKFAGDYDFTEVNYEFDGDDSFTRETLIEKFEYTRI